MSWKRILATITGSVDDELRRRNEYLVAENRVLRSRLGSRIALKDQERSVLARLGKALGLRTLAEIASIAKPETIRGWHRRLIERRDTKASKTRREGRPRVDAEVEKLVVRIARENRSWGYDRIVGALANLGFDVSPQTVGNILERNGIAPAPERARTTTWTEFIRTQRSVLVATDFLTVDAWTLLGLVRYYVLAFIHLGSRRVEIAGITRHPTEEWMAQVARNVTMEGGGFLNGMKFLLHDRDTKFSAHFRRLIRDGGVRPLALPARSPNLNAFVERWIRSVKDECLSRLIFFGRSSVERALKAYVEHYHTERNHQGIGNVILLPRPEDRVGSVTGRVVRRTSLGGLLSFYARRVG
ncbi:MAG: transposase [Planctomycetes bacterium]|nr:transposase [Planctomycetota bacterium]MCC7173016.1 transposase [Planctomycetota bacterium]